MTFRRRFTPLCVLVAFTTCLTFERQAFSQESASGSPSLDKSLVKELDALRAKVTKLEAALARRTGAQASTAGKGMMGKGMGMMSKGKKKMGRMGMGKMGGGMGMMGRGPKMGSMSMPSALPGFPGASHIYHIGETGFFLDHPQHVTLSADQQKKLNDIKTKALLAEGTFERQIDEAEQQLWMLTAADEPDVKKIEPRIREIAKLSGDRRLAFIRGVGDAAAVLTADQRQKLLGEYVAKAPPTSNE